MKTPSHIYVNKHKHSLYKIDTYSGNDLIKKSKLFYDWMDERRSVRNFSDKWVPKEVIENLIKTASTAPSGAHKQPWTFCAISNKELKAQIRTAAEKEERENYESRMSDRWKEDLIPFGTDSNKDFLETVPWIIVVFKKSYDINEKGEKENNYYVNESVGLACGMLITAIKNSGLVTLTHTPSPMNFLAKILDRPDNERPFLLLPVGYPANPCYVPDIKRKSLDEIAVFYE